MRKVSVSRLAFLAGAALCLYSTAAVADGPFQFYSVTPCRVLDTRTAQAPFGGPLSHGNVKNFPVRMPAVPLCGVSSTAKAAVLNVTVVQGRVNNIDVMASGHLTIFPYDPPPVAVPTVSTINFAFNEPALANGAIVPLTDDANLHVSVRPAFNEGAAGGVHLILDVTGYFQ